MLARIPAILPCAILGCARLAAESPAAPTLSSMRAGWDREPAAAPEDPWFRQAEKNSRFAAEAFFRSRKYIDGWLAHADPKSGLIPRINQFPEWFTLPADKHPDGMPVKLEPGVPQRMTIDPSQP